MKNITHLTKAQRQFMAKHPNYLIKEDGIYQCLWCKTNEYIKSVSNCRGMFECTRCDRINQMLRGK